MTNGQMETGHKWQKIFIYFWKLIHYTDIGLSVEDTKFVVSSQTFQVSTYDVKQTWKVLINVSKYEKQWLHLPQNC